MKIWWHCKECQGLQVSYPTEKPQKRTCVKYILGGIPTGCTFCGYKEVLKVPCSISKRLKVYGSTTIEDVEVGDWYYYRIRNGQNILFN